MVLMRLAGQGCLLVHLDVDATLGFIPSSKISSLIRCPKSPSLKAGRTIFALSPDYIQEGHAGCLGGPGVQWKPCFDFLGPSLLGDWLDDLERGGMGSDTQGTSGLSRSKWLCMWQAWWRGPLSRYPARPEVQGEAQPNACLSGACSERDTPISDLPLSPHACCFV